jgi:hypothetical protein
MLIDETHKTWIRVNVAILLVALTFYIVYPGKPVSGRSGGSVVGLTYGIAGFALMIFAGLLGARKRIPILRDGRAQDWMRGHLWLGLLSLPLILFHAGFRMRGPLTSIMMALFFILIASGIYGAVLQEYLPRRMTTRVKKEITYLEIPDRRVRLREDAHAVVVAASSRSRDAIDSNHVATAEITNEDFERLRDFYEREVCPFLGPLKRKHSPFVSAEESDAAFTRMRELLSVELHESLNGLKNICDEERQLAEQERIHIWLHGWLLVHIPLSFGVLVLGAVHAIIALRY